MQIRTVQVQPFTDQRPGTSGLRKKTRVFMQPHYLETFVQSVFDSVRDQALGDFGQSTLVVGGDGRYYNQVAIQKIIGIAIANGFGRILVARDGILSTPAMSAAIRRRKAFGGLILSASHNPGGPNEDFGVKYNGSNGGPAPERLTELIFRISKEISRYQIAENVSIPLDREVTTRVGDTEISVFDSCSDYLSLMEELFDFEALRGLFRAGFRMLFDAMNGVTGPYAKLIFEEKLGALPGSVVRGIPLEDFGGHHPDPNLSHAAWLVRAMNESSAPDMGAACDGDGDRNMILGRNFYVSPGDSLAVITEHAGAWIPGYRQGLAGVARSMPTSTALDRVAARLGIPCHETPTGWKYFGNLMDAGQCTICGEESFGTGSSHIREKDGLWAVLCWLSILAARGRSICEIVTDHWRRFGRSYYQRHDYEGLKAEDAEEVMQSLCIKLPTLLGKSLAESTVRLADEFRYVDPVDGSVSERQGVRILLEDGSRIIGRLSGTGTEGATLRVYFERYLQDGGASNVEEILRPLVDTGSELFQIRGRLQRPAPDVIT